MQSLSASRRTELVHRILRWTGDFSGFTRFALQTIHELTEGAVVELRMGTRAIDEGLPALSQYPPAVDFPDDMPARVLVTGKAESRNGFPGNRTIWCLPILSEWGTDGVLSLLTAGLPYREEMQLIAQEFMKRIALAILEPALRDAAGFRKLRNLERSRPLAVFQEWPELLEAESRGMLRDITVTSEIMWSKIGLLLRYARSRIPILLVGGTGMGKGLLARLAPTSARCREISSP